MIGLLKRFGRPFRRELTLGPASKLIEVIFDLLTPLVVALMIDRGVGERNVGVLLAYGALLVGMALAGFASTLICQKWPPVPPKGSVPACATRCSRISTRFRMSSSTFGTPSLITRITNDINQVQLAIALAIRQLTRFPLLAVGSMVAALLIDAKLGLIS